MKRSYTVTKKNVKQPASKVHQNYYNIYANKYIPHRGLRVSKQRKLSFLRKEKKISLYISFLYIYIYIYKYIMTSWYDGNDPRLVSQKKIP